MTDEERAADRSLLLLDEQLCFALYAAQRAVTAAYRPLLDELGLTYPQYLVLLVLWERGETTVKDLAAACGSTTARCSPLLKRLEAAGLVRRERAAHDERSVLGRRAPAAARSCGSARRACRARCSRRRGWTTAEVARLRGELWGLAQRAHPRRTTPARTRARRHARAAGPALRTRPPWRPVRRSDTSVTRPLPGVTCRRTYLPAGTLCTM